MKEDILRYLTTFNSISNVAIEYAILEPYLAVDGELQHNLHIVYTPKIQQLLKSYVSGLPLDVINETKITLDMHQSLVSQFIDSDKDQRSDLNGDDIKSVKKLLISNIARFCNFKIQSSTDPFLSMFLEEKNIIWKTEDFDEFFFFNREGFKPSKYCMGTSIIEVFNSLIQKSKDYAYHSQKEKLNAVYDELLNITRLYFITVRYMKTDELSSTMDDTHDLILNTLSQASRPWEFATECTTLLQGLCSEEAKKGNGSRVDPQKELLKAQALKFLHYKMCEEIKNPNYGETPCVTA